jgi:galactokinase
MNLALVNSRSLDLNSLRASVVHTLESRYGLSAKWAAAAPGRVNLIGEHTDYNGGFVLPMAIDRHIMMAAAPRSTSSANRDATANCYSIDLDEQAAIKLSGEIAPGAVTWASYLQGVVAEFVARGFEIEPFDVVIGSTVPLGGGLSSSAALEVAMATLLETMLGQTLDKNEKALLCQQAEHRFAGVPCGIMDQFSIVFGQAGSALLLDCRDHSFDNVPIDPQVAVLIANTNVSHELTGGEYERRRADCDVAARTLNVSLLRDATIDQLEKHKDSLDAVVFRRARHVINEIARTWEAAESLRHGQWEHFGSLMYASHESLRDDYDVSSPELDMMVNIAQEIGVSGGMFGSRMTGAGFGGCTVSLIASDRADAIASHMGEEYRKRVDIVPSIFVTRAVAGARSLGDSP